MTPQQILTLLRNGNDSVEIARRLGRPEAVISSALHLAREEEYRAKHPHSPTFPAEREPLVAHYRRWRNVQVAKIRGLAETGVVERAGSGQGETGHGTV